MNIEHCREFIELSRTLNFTETANNLHLTQSTLSKHISALERELGAKLFIRQHDGIRLTEEGYVFVGSATNILDIYKGTRETFESMKSEEAISIDGQLEDTGVSGFMSMAIMINNNRHQTPIRFNHNRTKDKFTLLKEDDIDMLIMGGSPSQVASSGFKYINLLTSPFVAIVDPDHAFAAREYLSVSDLRNETLIQFLDEYSQQGWYTIEDVCKQSGFSPKRKPVLTQSVTEQLATPLHGCVLIFPKTSKELRFLVESMQRHIVPIIDEAAAFQVYGIYKEEREEKLKPFLDALQEAKHLMDSSISS